MSKLLHEDLTYKIRGILFSIQNELGNYRNEKQYGDAFEHKLKGAEIRYEREKVLTESFTGELKGRNRVDFLINNLLIIEFKSTPSLSRDDYFQCQRYLTSMELELCLLVNFRPKHLMIKRILNPIKHQPSTIRKSGLSGYPDSIIIGLAGSMASGKGTAARYLKETYGASTYRFSGMLGDILDRLYLERNRDNFIKISEIIRATFGEDIMAKTMARDVAEDPNRIIVVEGVRRLADIEYLSQMEGFILVEIFADIKTRFERLIKRTEKADDRTKTFAEFQADHQRSTELSIIEVVKLAQKRINNNGTLKELHKQLDKLVMGKE